jgi:replicative DNA helicase
MLHGGFEPGGFTLLGGTPGTGKTSLMLSLALHAATKGIKVAFIEGEMTAPEILERLNGIATGAAIAEIRRGIRYEELSSDFLSRFHTLPFEIVPLYDRTLETLTDEIRAQAHSGAKLVFVDYLQVFTSKTKAADEFFDIKKTSEKLRALALQHGIHLFVATALNRTERQAERLTLNSFYGSSGLGHDCSIGLILSGEQSDESELFEPIRSVKLQVVKNRSGVRGELALKFHLHSQRFEEA